MRPPSLGWVFLRRASYLLSLAFLLAGVFKPVAFEKAKGIEYLVVFDVSLSMATEDYTDGGVPKSRLEVAKELFRQVVPDLPPQARITLAGFAGNTAQIFLLSRPVREIDAIEAALAVLEWDNVWDVGSRIDRALWDIVAQAKGSTVFSVRGRRRILPSPLNIVFFTDGGASDVRGTVSGDATAWLLRNARVTFVGVGQPWTSTVPEFKRTRPRDCLRDEAGRCLTSRLNEESLHALADWVEGRYERLRDGAHLTQLFLHQPLTGTYTEVPQEVGWLFGLGSLAFFLLWIVL